MPGGWSRCVFTNREFLAGSSRGQAVEPPEQGVLVPGAAPDVMAVAGLSSFSRERVASRALTGPTRVEFE